MFHEMSLSVSSITLLQNTLVRRRSKDSNRSVSYIIFATPIFF